MIRLRPRSVKRLPATKTRRRVDVIGHPTRRAAAPERHTDPVPADVLAAALATPPVWHARSAPAVCPECGTGVRVRGDELLFAHRPGHDPLAPRCPGGGGA